MDDSPPYRLDIPGLADDCAAVPRWDGGLRGRPWVGIHFECCAVYARVYRHPEGALYSGACPRCGRRVTLRVGPDGTEARFFTAR